MVVGRQHLDDPLSQQSIELTLLVSLSLMMIQLQYHMWILTLMILEPKFDVTGGKQFKNQVRTKFYKLLNYDVKQQGLQKNYHLLYNLFSLTKITNGVKLQSSPGLDSHHKSCKKHLKKISEAGNLILNRCNSLCTISISKKMPSNPSWWI